jgi:RNA polymerase sigma-70 factor (ECF subfamily)
VETDGTLIERSVRGSPDAFVEVVRRHEIAVHGFLARRAGQQVAADLLGEVWLRAFAGRGGYDPAYPDARPWLFGIARNVLRAHWRANPGENLTPAESALAETTLTETAVDPWDEVDDRLDSAPRIRALASAVRALPPDERDVLLLVAWEQLTPAQAATVLGVPQGTARSRLHRARSALRPHVTAGPAEVSVPVVGVPVVGVPVVGVPVVGGPDFSTGEEET